MDVLREEEFKSKGLYMSVWKKIAKIARPYKKQFIILAMFMMFAAALDVLFQWFGGYAIDNIITPGDKSKIPIIAIGYAVAAIMQALNIFFFIRIAGKIETHLSYDLRKKAFEKLQNLSMSYFDKTPVGWIMARMTSDSRRLSEMISWGLVDSCWGLSMMLMIMVFMLAKNWRLALVTLSVIPLLMAAAVYFQKKILKWYREVRKINSKITGSFNEGISGSRTTKTLLTEDSNYRQFANLTENMRSSSIKAAIFSSFLWPIVISLGNVGMAIALTAGGIRVMNNTITLGTLAVFISLASMFFMPVQDLARILSEFQRAQASAERIMSLLEKEPDIVEDDKVVEIFGDNLCPRYKNWPRIKGDVMFENVSFKYKDGEKILSNFNLYIKSGESIALVGETGSGKSTIVNLACRFYEPVEGRVLIDGVDYKKRSQLWLHSNLGYVLQTPFLFSGTVKENIKYGSPLATMDDVVNAAKLVNADGFINKLEDGYNTQVGEGGGRLSTGQKQLISFARAILKDPKILILDEATSSVDTETEYLIQEAVNLVMKGRTSFVIAHRLSTIKNADRILVIDKGRVIEEGSHNTLLNKRGYYYNLYTNQFIEEEGTTFSIL